MDCQVYQNSENRVNTLKSFENYRYEIPDKDKIEFLTSRPWFTNSHKNLNEILNELAPDTHIVAVPFEHIEINNVTNKCELFDTRIHDIKLIKMENSRCHDNCEILFNSCNSNKLYSGYALSQDGLWRFHSWCVDKNNCILETTQERLIYYGIQI
mgnify:CR=1 FL=1